MELVSIHYIIVIFIGILGLIKPVRAFIKHWWNRTVGRRGLKIDRILMELQSNNGTSLKDAIVRIEERQQTMDAFFRAQLNLHNVAIVRTDAFGKLTAVNRQYQRMTGYSLAEVQGDGWINTIHPKDQERVKRNWAAAVGGKREYVEDIQIKTALGDTFMAHASVFREIDADGTVRGYLGTIVPMLDFEKPIECEEALAWIRMQQRHD